MIKDASEIATLRDAAARLDQVMPAALASVRAGETERAHGGGDRGGDARGGLRAHGLRHDCRLRAARGDAALPRGRRAMLAAGDLLVLDFGGVLDGYCCDLTRTVSIGAPSDEAQRVYDAVLRRAAAAIAAVRPGVEASAVDAAARSVLDANAGSARRSGMGPVMASVSRFTRSRGSDSGASGYAAGALAPGMVFTIEPGAYLPGFGGVRIEDDVLVTETGCDVLTASAGARSEAGEVDGLQARAAEPQP